MIINVMKKYTLILLAICFGFTQSVYSQCGNNNVYYTDLTPSGVGETATSNCTNGGEYNTFYACQGAQYTISTCGSAFNTVVTMYWHVSGDYIYYTNSNNCTSNHETFTWTATETGIVRVLIDRGNGCNTSSLCAIMSITQVTECPEIVTAGDCADAVNVCTNINFYIDPNGFGAVNEIPDLGSIANPDYGHAEFNPWGTTNEGCLRANELNSTWMLVNVETGGTLAFTFGGLGTQIGYYDWTMFEYDANTCSDILNDQIAPIRCNWNGVNYGGTGIGPSVPSGGHTSNYEPHLDVNDLDRFMIVFSNWSSVTTNVPLQFYGTAVVSCTAISPLPVELISFTGKPEGKDAILSWNTATEINNDFFRLERSKNNADWETITTLNGQGFSAVISNYNFLDKNPGTGTFYYRLSQQDFNGEGEMLGTIAVTIESDNWEVFPNPSESHWQIIASQNLANCSIKLWDITGKEIPIQCEITDYSARINMNDQRAGLYFMQVSNASGNVMHQSRLLAK
jgi:hypothetical protein